MDTKTLRTTVQELGKALLDATSLTESIGEQLFGPRPADSTTAPMPMGLVDTLDSLLCRARILNDMLAQLANVHGVYDNPPPVTGGMANCCGSEKRY